MRKAGVVFAWVGGDKTTGINPILLAPVGGLDGSRTTAKSMQVWLEYVHEL